MKALRRFERMCAAVERVSAVVLFSALTLLLFLNIALRSLLGISLAAILEFVPAIVLWLALIGAGLALREGRHIKIELLLRWAPAPARRVARRFAAACGLIITGVLFPAAIEFVRNEAAIFGPVGMLSLIMPVFFGLSMLRFLIAVLDPDAGQRTPTATTQAARAKGMRP